MIGLSAAALHARSVAGNRLGRRLAPRWAYTDAQLRGLQEARARRVLNAAMRLPGYAHLDIARADLSDPLAFLGSTPALDKSHLRGRERDFWRTKRSLAAATSGTTGTPLRLRRTLASVLEEEAWVAQSRLWAGFHRGQRIAELRGALVPSDGTDVPHAWSEGLGKLTLSSYHLTPLTVRRYAALLHRHRVEWLAAYPSSVTALLVLAEQERIELPHFRGVFTSSENLTAANRAFIAERLGCPIWDHYGNAERTVAASQCECLRYHLLPGYALVAPEGRHLVTTGLTNTAMPLLQYLVTDEVSGWSEDRCECGRRGPTISGINGRSESFLIGEDGRLVGRMDHVFKGVSGAVTGQLHQHREGHLTVRVVASGEVPEEELVETLAKRTQSRMGNIDVEVEVVDRLAPQANGKVPFVVQELDVPGGDS